MTRFRISLRKVTLRDDACFIAQSDFYDDVGFVAQIFIAQDFAL